jgi:hypothetical protein
MLTPSQQTPLLIFTDYEMVEAFTHVLRKKKKNVYWLVYHIIK